MKVQVSEAVGIAIANLQHHIESNNAVVTAGEMPVVMGDRTQIAMLFQNLIANSLKFRRSVTPKIEIEASREGDVWRFSVTDNGQGFEEEHGAAIFEPFKRLHGRDVPGSGIGLATCRRIVESMGGSIWAKSTPGVGSTFSFVLPSAAPLIAGAPKAPGS